MMLAADYAISRIRRDLTLGAFVRFLLLGAALACLLVGPFVSTVFWPVTNQIPSIDGLVLQTHPPAQRRGFSPQRGNILLTRRDSCPRRKSSCPPWKDVSPSRE